MRSMLARVRSELRMGTDPDSNAAVHAPSESASVSSAPASASAAESAVAGALDELSLSSDRIAILKTLRDRFRAAIDAFGNNVADRSPVECALEVMLDTYEAFRKIRSSLIVSKPNLRAARAASVA